MQGQWAPPSPAKAGEGAVAAQPLSLPLLAEQARPSRRREEGAAAGAVTGAPSGEGAAAPPPTRARAKARKDKWEFTAADGGLLCVAGLWRAGVVPPPARTAGAGGDAAGEPRATEAFTMLTCAPGPDIAPYHSRQIVLMPRGSWADWLAGVPAAELIAPTPAGTLRVTRVR